MKGVVLITGATSGIGKQTALALAEMGYQVNVLARSKSKSAELVMEARLRLDKDIHVFLCDISDFESVRKVASDIRQKLPKIDILINNAGAIFDVYEENPQGIELTMATNHFGPFLLTNLLLDNIIDGGRIINVSSMAHLSAKLNLSDVNQKATFSVMTQYSISKLANILFTKHLAQMLSSRNITVNALHPGVVRTGFGQNMRFPFGLLWKFLGFFFISSKKGAETSIYLATSDEVVGITGKYFVKKVETESSSESNDVELSKRLWELSEYATGLNV